MAMAALFVCGLNFWAGLHTVTLPENQRIAIEDSLNVLMCFAGIIICFCGYGTAQEYIMTVKYRGEPFPSVAFVILTNRFFLVTFSGLTMWFRQQPIALAPTKWSTIPATTVLVSSYCQYASLYYVTFPTQVVFKSAKIVPTMVLQTLMTNVSSSLPDYFSALLITMGCAGFSLVTEQDEGHEDNKTIGILMLVVFLVADSLTSNSEKYIYNKYPEFTNVQMMFALGVVSLVYSVVMTAVSPGYSVVLTFVQRNPDCWSCIIALGICSTAGQWMLTYCIRRHGPVLTAIMMTVRQIMSVFISALLYKHGIRWEAYFCAVGVFAVCLSKPLWKLSRGELEGKRSARKPSRGSLSSRTLDEGESRSTVSTTAGGSGEATSAALPSPTAQGASTERSVFLEANYMNWPFGRSRHAKDLPQQKTSK
eukprot:gnl/TRDRNA2_/TRDRNA2_62822_c1_seq1.p1 gnl/TRDRNA2_/TRDRNA2_62822_c1~~gnl/TRDRNA2_/TRDRNA2_62822_c1_seq1.p1  ORF type:complete len:479 (+),score=53.91 gnl/TRDRNA2_/TRDRNA2_62822_c1_seq1:174-1439(+)